MVADVRSGKATVTSALTRLLRLQQIASGFLPAENDEDGTTNLQQINTGKQELLADLLEGLPACDRCPDPGRRHWVRPSALGQAGGTRIVVMSERPWEVTGAGQATRSFSLLEFFAPFGENKKRGVADSKKGGSGQQKGG